MDGNLDEELTLHDLAEEVLPELEAYLERLTADGWFEDDRRSRPMVKAMLLCHFLSPDVSVVAGYGQLPLRLVRWVLQRYREEGILTPDGTLETTYSAGETAEASLMGDRLVLEGRAIRTFEDGEWWYWDRPIKRRPGETRHRYHRRLGMCALCDDAVMPGRSLCHRHARGGINWAKRSKREASGMCIHCGKRPASPKKNDCRSCESRRFRRSKKKVRQKRAYHEPGPRKPRVLILEYRRRELFAGRDTRVLTREQEDALVDAAMAGDVVCIARLLSACEPGCQAAARHPAWLRDDLLQEARLAVVLLLRTFQPKQIVNFVAAAANASREAAHSLRRRLNPAEPLPDDLPGPESHPRDILALHRANAAFLHDLTPRERCVIQGRFLQGQSLNDIGKQLHLCRERVRIIEVDTLRSLRRLVERHRFSIPSPAD